MGCHNDTAKITRARDLVVDVLTAPTVDDRTMELAMLLEYALGKIADAKSKCPPGGCRVNGRLSCTDK